MEVFQTEEQQVDAIKGFWKENGTGIIAGLVIGFSSFIGYGYYTQEKAAQELLTAENYQALVEDLSNDTDGVAESAQEFISNNTDSSYAPLTAFILARKAADKSDWTQAATHLQQAIDTANVEAIKAIAVTRLARVQIQLDETEKALATLSAVVPASFNATVDEIKGDAYLRQGKKDLARNAYQLALAASGAAGNQALQMKLDDLAEVVSLSNVNVAVTQSESGNTPE